MFLVSVTYFWNSYSKLNIHGINRLPGNLILFVFFCMPITRSRMAELENYPTVKMNEGAALQCFINGLPEILQQHCVLAQCETLAQAFEQAQLKLASLSTITSSTKQVNSIFSDSSPSSTGPDLQTQIDELSYRINLLSASNRFDHDEYDEQ